jgi:hypothetical protein
MEGLRKEGRKEGNNAEKKKKKKKRGERGQDETAWGQRCLGKWYE